MAGFNMHVPVCVQAAKDEVEYLGEIEAQLHMLEPLAPGDLQALRGIQVGGNRTCTHASALRTHTRPCATR